ncbi:hypothetical protein EZV62_022781 [Acer yangbiense]|uniref:KIB1-4 beta-propeller domain-containing protein n=1 Tax=Acer yangbiense TaxID=1000413 RepID=A0A5C7H0C8_9ROSI|nr:hypothetical protein EZV62_022781 [Acer yangbiense]
MAKVNVNGVVEGIGKQLKLSGDSLVLSKDLKLLRLWRSAASKKNSRFRASSVVPWLMLPPKEKGSDVCSFFSLSKAIDIKSDNTVVAKRVVADLPPELVPLAFCKKFYLVESAGKILVVGRRLRYERTQTYADYGTTAFRVVEVDLSRNENEWSPVENLGNRALFVGDNSSLSVQVFDNSNFKPNCIYFTDDWKDQYFSSRFPEGVGRDMGIYNLQDGSIERIETRFTSMAKGFH